MGFWNENVLAGKSLVKAMPKKELSDIAKKYIKVVAPSSTANLGPGFDVFGLAHSAFRDLIEIEVINRPELQIEVHGIDSGQISCDPNKNTAGFVAKLIMEMLSIECGLRISIEKGIPVGRGLGSSGASAAACIVGLNRIFGLNLTNNEMIQLAAKGESVSAGTEHADNVAASLLGGFAFIQFYNPLQIISLDPPPNMAITLVIPKIPIIEGKTKKARKILPRTVPIERFVYNVSHASSIVAGILLGDVEMIGKGMDDAIVEPVRSKLIPGYDKVKQNALKAGASGVAISGAGHTMIAIVNDFKVSVLKIAESMKEAFENEGIECDTVTSKPSKGASIIEER